MRKGESGILVEVAAEVLELGREGGVEMVTRKAERGSGKFSHRRTIRARDERGAVETNSAGTIEQREQPETLKNRQPIATDEFTANAVAWIVAGFDENGGNSALAQADAECEPGETPADDGDGLRRGHIQPFR
jgi:hypothetical protein